MKRWLLVLLFALAGLLGVAQPASAHASLEAVHPHANSILDSSPAQVTLTFGEVVSAQLGGIKVFGPDGKRVDVGRVQAVDNNVSIDLKPNLGQGTYTVSWRVISADSHPVSGGYVFSVGHKSTATKVSSATPPWTLRLMWLGRISSELGVIVLVGGLLFIAFIYPGARQVRSLDRTIRGGALVLLIGTALEFFMEGPDAAGLGPGSAFTHELVSDIAKTDFGHAHIIRAVLVLAAVYPGLPRLPRPVAVLYGAGLAVTFSFSGHPASDSSRVWAILQDTIHVLAASAWLGGIVALLVLLKAKDEAVRDRVGQFSVLAFVSVIAIIATGTLASIREVGSLFALTSTRAGHLLLIKIAFVIVMLGLGFISHRRSKNPARNLAAAVGREAVAGIAVIGMTSALIAAPTARTAALRPFAMTRTVASGVCIELDVDNAMTGVDEVHEYVTDCQGKAIPVQSLRVTMAKPDDGVSPIDIPLNPPKSQPIGHKENLSWEISIKGIWTFTAYAQIDKFSEYSALYLVTIK